MTRFWNVGAELISKAKPWRDDCPPMHSSTHLLQHPVPRADPDPRLWGAHGQWWPQSRRSTSPGNTHHRRSRSTWLSHLGPWLYQNYVWHWKGRFLWGWTRPTRQGSRWPDCHWHLQDLSNSARSMVNFIVLKPWLLDSLPQLLSRPLMEEFGAIIDIGSRIVSFKKIGVMDFLWLELPKATLRWVRRIIGKSRCWSWWTFWWAWLAIDPDVIHDFEAQCPDDCHDRQEDLNFIREEVASIQRAINRGDVSPIPGFAPPGFNHRVFSAKVSTPSTTMSERPPTRRAEQLNLGKPPCIVIIGRSSKSSLERLAACPTSRLRAKAEAALCWTDRSFDFGHMFWT